MQSHEVSLIKSHRTGLALLPTTARRAWRRFPYPCGRVAITVPRRLACWSSHFVENGPIRIFELSKIQKSAFSKKLS